LATDIKPHDSSEDDADDVTSSWRPRLQQQQQQRMNCRARERMAGSMSQAAGATASDE